MQRSTVLRPNRLSWNSIETIEIEDATPKICLRYQRRFPSSELSIKFISDFLLNLQNRD